MTRPMWQYKIKQKTLTEFNLLNMLWLKNNINSKIWLEFQKIIWQRFEVLLSVHCYFLQKKVSHNNGYVCMYNYQKYYTKIICQIIEICL